MNRLNIGLIGFGNVGSGVVKLLKRRKNYLKNKFGIQFKVSWICDKYIQQKRSQIPAGTKVSKDYRSVTTDKHVDVVVELIGGLHPAKEIIVSALKNKKDVVTANKAVISEYGKELFALAKKYGRNIYFESAVGAGTPMIKTITEGITGNAFKGLYGIINGTCNYILTEMTQKGCSFKEALTEAQKKGFAESNPILDINGMDSAHKLAILVYLALGKSIKVENIYTEGITHIAHTDIEHAESLNLTIKLLAIAKKVENGIEARVHPTLISKYHPLASINGIYNALYLAAEPLGDILISGEGAGQMAAASGVFSDLINLASKRGCPSSMLGNIIHENKGLKLRKIDQIRTKFYLRFMASDKPGVLSKISGILGKHGISINSVTQKVHSRASAVPVVMLSDYAPEKMLRLALNKIHKLSIVKSKPVAIRMEKLQ